MSHNKPLHAHEYDHDLVPQGGYRIKLDNFEGPLDLLLHLIERSELDIYNIPIAQITNEFLDYLKDLDLLDLKAAGEFLVMAATLMQIKVRMLLPKPVTPEEELLEEEEDPRLELVERLLEYKKIKEVSKTLRSWEEESSRFFQRSGGYFPNQEAAAALDIPGNLTLWDLVQAFKSLLESLTPRLELDGMPDEDYSITDLINQIDREVTGKKRVFFSSLFKELKSRKAIITSFLALLELIRLRRVKAIQSAEFTDIEIVQWEENKDEFDKGQSHN